MEKLWGGRFSKATDWLVDDFHSSISFDSRLYRYDIKGSIAHAKMLAQVGIITASEADILVQGLLDILKGIEDETVEFSVAAEDIHMNIEQLLIAEVGEVGKKLHTARSRNDQIALDMRMYLRDELDEVRLLLAELVGELLDLAEKHLDTLMPGYTHLQRAQPISLAHHLLAYVQMFLRDMERLADCRRRVNVLPLGAGALAGTTFPLDRDFVAQELGFDSLTENSLDAVSDRDFAVEFTGAAALIMVHLSRFCEEIILWSSMEFDFIELDDGYSTGSSMMPQKKNPDVAELIRGKSGRVFGDLQALLTMLKGLPLAYNKDMQEDKEALFDTVDTVKKCLFIFRPMVATATVHREKMAQATEAGFTNATDLADYLVRKGVPFREAHIAVGRAVAYCLQQDKSLAELSLEKLRDFVPDGVALAIEEDVYRQISIDHCVENRRVIGGPAPEAVREAIDSARQRLSKENLNRMAEPESLEKTAESQRESDLESESKLDKATENAVLMEECAESEPQEIIDPSPKPATSPLAVAAENDEEPAVPEEQPIQKKPRDRNKPKKQEELEELEELDVLKGLELPDTSEELDRLVEIVPIKEELEQMADQNRWNEIAELIEAIPEAELDWDIIGWYIRALNNSGQAEKAIEVALKYAEQGKDDAMWHYRLGYAYWWLDRFEEAEPILLRAKELAAGNTDLIEWLDELICKNDDEPE